MKPGVAAIAGVSVALLAASIVPAGAQLSGRVRLAWQQHDQDAVESDGLHQIWEIGLDRALSDALRVSFGARWEDDASGATLYDGETTADSRRLEPRIRLLYAIPTVILQVDAVRFDQLSESEAFGTRNRLDRQSDELRALFSWQPVDLPSLTVDASRLKATESESGLDLEQSSAGARVAYNWRELQISAGARRREATDRTAGFEQESDEASADLAWSAALLGDRLAVDFAASAGKVESSDRALFGRPVDVPERQRLSAAYQTVDPTPEEHRDAPLTGNFQLRDGVVDRPAGASLGPDAPTHLNLALDFGGTVPVDEVRILVRDPAGRPVVSGGPVRWELWGSVDGEHWAPLPGGADSAFDAPRGYYRVRFEERELRFLQLVTFFVNSVPTEITEVEAYRNRTVQSTEPLGREVEYTSGRGGVSFRPHERLTLGAQLLVARSLRSSDTEVEAESNDQDRFFTVRWDVTRRATFELRNERRELDSRTGLVEERRRYDAWVAAGRYEVNRNLHATVELQRGESDSSLGVVELERQSLRTYARIYPGLEVALDLGSQQQRIVGTDFRLDGPTLAATLRATLRRGLSLIVTGSVDELEVRGGALPDGGELAVAGRTERWVADLTWAPSSRLEVGFGVGSAGTDGGSTPIQRYRLRWTPFAGGALSIGASYDQDVDPRSDSSARRLLLDPSWRINDRSLFTLGYERLETSSEGIEAASTTVRSGVTIDF